MFVFLAAKKSKPAAPNCRLENFTKKISKKAYMEIADSAFSRMRGLMFRDEIIPILFIFDSVGKFPIHSNFVKDVFDAIYLSKEGEVVEMLRKIPPNVQLVSPKKDAAYLLELPVYLTDELKIKEGNVIRWTMEKGIVHRK